MKSEIEIITCKHCGVTFMPRDFRQKYCCEAHARAGYQPIKKHSYICKHCGKQYKTHRKECNQYCSREHADIHRHQHYATWKAERLKARELVCPFCGADFIRMHSRQKYCSVECRKQDALRSLECRKQDTLRSLKEKRTAAHLERTFHCKECGSKFVPTYGDKHRSFCSHACSNRQGTRLRDYRKRSNRFGSIKAENIKNLTIYERDRWICQLCGEPIDREAAVPKPLAPTLDHIVPLSKGGLHIYDNVQCAHFLCNIRKGSHVVYPPSINLLKGVCTATG